MVTSGCSFRPEPGFTPEATERKRNQEHQPSLQSYFNSSRDMSSANQFFGSIRAPIEGIFNDRVYDLEVDKLLKQVLILLHSSR